NKTIWIHAAEDTGTLLHEMVHAVTGAGHKKAFCARLHRVADRALALGEEALAAQLHAEAQAYADPSKIRSATAADVYGRVEEWVTYDAPEGLTCEQVIHALCYEYGMTPSELLRAYPRIPRVYARALRKDIAATRGAMQMLHPVKHLSQRVECL